MPVVGNNTRDGGPCASDRFGRYWSSSLSCASCLVQILSDSDRSFPSRQTLVLSAGLLPSRLAFFALFSWYSYELGDCMLGIRECTNPARNHLGDAFVARSVRHMARACDLCVV